MIDSKKKFDKHYKNYFIDKDWFHAEISCPCWALYRFSEYYNAWGIVGYYPTISMACEQVERIEEERRQVKKWNIS